ncbi:MAG: site-specific DNA-methyltransferase [Pirellulaceae bacterium]
MKPLTKAEKAELKKLIDSGDALPESWLSRLFPGGVAASGTQDTIGKEYRLVYEGKLTREEVLAQTPAAPWQLVRSFCDERPHEDGWQNLLVWGDNLMAMRELLADQRGPNRFGTRDKIKLVYIDPPFATKRDFMKDKERAYRDKVVGAKFIEFLRTRLILLRELMADDGSIYVHLDTKKSHYIKAALDEVFSEHNFQSEIIWKRTSAHSDSSGYANVHDVILYYSKKEQPLFNTVYTDYSEAHIKRRYSHFDPDGRRYTDGDLVATGLKGGGYDYVWKGVERNWRCPIETMRRYESEDRLYYTREGLARIKRYFDEVKGNPPADVWSDIFPVNSQAGERVNYPTQKPESLLERVLRASSNPDDIVLDCFSGSGTTPVVCEKLGRRWIAIDCGKLAVYTAQKRLFSLSTQIGSGVNDTREPAARVEDWSDHEKKARGALFVTEKARKGECDITIDLLEDLAALADKHKLVKDDTPLSIVCPEAKLKIRADRLYEPDEGPGAKAIKVGGMEFRISFIEPKEKPEKEKPLLAKQFALYRAGVYDMARVQSLPWDAYRPLVMKLFGVREAPHTRYGYDMDGYVRGDATLVWNCPENPKLSLDREYVESLHKMVRGKSGERIYVIAPVVAMAFMEDEITVGKTTYVFLKVPVSVLMRLIEHGVPAALPQPMREDDVNEVIDAVGFDFVSQPLVEYCVRKSDPTDGLLQSFMVEVTLFKAQTLATDADDFRNFETLSMVMLDLNYDGDVFRLSEVHWGEELVKEAGGIDEAKTLAISIPADSFVGDRMMMILCDRYGNEKTLAIDKTEFKAKKRTTKTATANKATTKKKPAKRKTTGGSR